MKGFATALVLTLAAALLQACGGSGGANRGAAPAASPADSQTAAPPRSSTPLSEFERDLRYVRNGQFRYTLVFSRKDGAKFTPEDITYLKANSPQETNQWVSTDQGRRVIAGSNFEFTVEHIEALQQRFQVEDFSGR